MKWIGAHIWDWVTRFRNDVHLEKDTYLESIANQGSGNLASKHLTVDNGTGKVLFRTGAELKADIGSLELGTTSLTALAGSTVTITFAQTQAITANTTGVSSLTTFFGLLSSAVTLNTAKTSFPGFGTTSTTALAGDTALLQIGTTGTTALAGNTAYSTLALGNTSTTALAGDTALLALGTTSTTALAGDTTTISPGQAAEITANTAKVGITTGVQTISGVKTFSDAIVSSGLTTASNGNILIDPDGTGSITLKSNDIIFEGAGTVTVPSLKLQEAPLLEGNYVGFAPPLSVTANTLWTLPDGDGTNAQALSTNGSGILSWTSYLPAQNPSTIGVVSVKPVHAASPGKIDTYLGSTDQTLTADRKIILDGNNLLIEDAAGTQVAKIFNTGYFQNKGRLIVDGHTTSGAYVKLAEATNNGTSSISLQAPTSLSANVNLVLPDADGTSGQALVTNGSGVLSFASASGGSSASSLLTTYGGRVQHSTSYDNRMIMCGGIYGLTYYIWSTQVGVTASGGGTVDSTTMVLSSSYQHYGAIKVPSAGQIKVDFITRPLNSNSYSKPYVLQLWEFDPVVNTTTGPTCTLRAKGTLTSASATNRAATGTMTSVSDVAAGKYIFVTIGMDAQTISSTAYQYTNINVTLLA